MDVPSVNVLAHHDAVSTHVPHARRTMLPRLKLVVSFLTFVSALDGGAPLVEKVPLIRVARRVSEQSGIVLAVGTTRFPVTGGGTRSWAVVSRPACHSGTQPLVYHAGTI